MTALEQRLSELKRARAREGATADQTDEFRAGLRRRGYDGWQVASIEFAQLRYLADTRNPLTRVAAECGEPSDETCAQAERGGFLLDQVRECFRLYAASRARGGASPQPN